MKNKDIKKVVRESYGKIAKQNKSCCSSNKSCCKAATTTATISKNIGYSDKELNTVPDGANLGLGCGNPIALASLKEGETVLDLGSGAGFDCFLAANKVGPTGKVIGIDMTPEMVEKAKENAEKGGYKNVVFKLSEIENLLVDDNSVDVIISNCVINLSPDKKKVFEEAFRALKPGGRLMVSDIVLLKELPQIIKDSIESYVGCIAGAEMKDRYLQTITAAGFSNVELIEETSYPAEYMSNDPTVKSILDSMKISLKQIKEIANSVLSIKVYGVKP